MTIVKEMTPEEHEALIANSSMLPPPMMAAGMLRGMELLIATNPEKVRIYMQSQWALLSSALKAVVEVLKDDEDLASAYIFMALFFRSGGLQTAETFKTAANRLLASAPHGEHFTPEQALAHFTKLSDQLGEAIAKILQDATDFDEGTRLSLKAGMIARPNDKDIH